MSYRLTQRGHRPVAVDIFTDAEDGLAAARDYDLFPTVEAEFDGEVEDVFVFAAANPRRDDLEVLSRDLLTCVRVILLDGAAE